MGRADMKSMLKKRMEATQQASELQLGDEVYEQVFKAPEQTEKSTFCDLPIENLRPFFTADIGFKPYPQEKLKAFSEQLAEEGLFERVIVRRIANSDDFEIIAGHNRTSAGRMAGWTTIPCEIVEADDARATSIAVATNLMRRQGLSIIERGKAYKALLQAKNRNGQRNIFGDDLTFGEVRQRYNAREIVATFFGVTEYEIRKAIKMTCLIPELQEILLNQPRKLSLACAEVIAEYDTEGQKAFLEMCSIEGYQLNKTTVQHICVKCTPPSAATQAIYAAWREARAMEEQRKAAPPKKISFDRKRFAPYLDKLGGEKEIEKLFLEFLKERIN
ncbi:ParB/RepB/Spo0J family partition protein [Dysosmobacter sp.]